MSFIGALTTEVIQHDVFILNTQIFEHLDAGGIHHGGTTHVKLHILWSRMVLQIILKDDVMNKSGVAIPIVFRLWIRQRQMPLKVIILCCQTIVLVS